MAKTMRCTLLLLIFAPAPHSPSPGSELGGSSAKSRGLAPETHGQACPAPLRAAGSRAPPLPPPLARKPKAPLGQAGEGGGETSSQDRTVLSKRAGE